MIPELFASPQSGTTKKAASYEKGLLEKAKTQVRSQ